MLQYFFKMAKGDFVGLNAEQISRVFGEVSTSKNSMIFWMFVIVVLGFLVCSLGLQNGVEKITKVMMVVLLALMLVLAVRSCTLDGASEGLKFYLLPDFKKLTEYNVTEVVFAAMGQAFFTLSLGIGALAIFGSYIGKERKLTGEAISITILDTFVAIANALDVSADTLLIDVVAHSVTGVTNELTEKIEKLPIKEQKNFIGMLYYQIDIGMW